MDYLSILRINLLQNIIVLFFLNLCCFCVVHTNKIFPQFYQGIEPFWLLLLAESYLLTGVLLFYGRGGSTNFRWLLLVLVLVGILRRGGLLSILGWSSWKDYLWVYPLQLRVELDYDDALAVDAEESVEFLEWFLVVGVLIAALLTAEFLGIPLPLPLPFPLVVVILSFLLFDSGVGGKGILRC